MSSIISANVKNMEIRQLRALIAIAETGTFTACALRVNLTQAAVSMQIQQLEKETGAQLFIRRPRRVMLTEVGEALLEHARRILREHDAALDHIARLAGADHGRLRVGSASAMVNIELLPQILKDLHAQYPRAEVSVTTGTSEALVRLIVAGELDLAMVSLPVEARGVKTETLSRDELVAIGSPDHALAKHTVVSAEMLAKEKLILGERGGNTRRLIDTFFAKAGVSPTIKMELNRLAAIKRMAQENLGVGIVPLRSVAAEVSSGQLVAWWIKAAKINWELGLASLTGSHVSPLTQTFIQICRQHFGQASVAPSRQAAKSSNKQAKSKRK